MKPLCNILAYTKKLFAAGFTEKKFQTDIACENMKIAIVGIILFSSVFVVTGEVGKFFFTVHKVHCSCS